MLTAVNLTKLLHVVPMKIQGRARSQRRATMMVHTMAKMIMTQREIAFTVVKCLLAADR